MDKNRFKKLLESKLGNVKPLIFEEEKKVIELTDLNAQVPDSLIDGQPVDGTYVAVGGRSTPEISNTFTLCYGDTCFKVPGKHVRFNWAPGGLGQLTSVKVSAVRNSFFFTPYVENGKTYDLIHYLNNKPVSEVINNSEDKTIGFSKGSFEFFCYVPKKGGEYECSEWKYEVKK